MVKFGFFLHLLIVITINNSISEAVLEFEPAGVLYVCLEGALRVNCSTTAHLLEWSVTIPGNQRPVTRAFQTDGTRTTTTPISVNSTTLTISRSLPLNSMIFTDNTTADFNGTVITCSEQTDHGITLSSASVQIILIGNNGGHNVNITPHILNISQWFETNSITVALEWTTKNGASYSVSVVPEVAINYTGRSSVQLSLSYNIIHNISITASLCGRNSTTFSALNHLNCGEPSPPMDGFLDPYTSTSEGARVNRVHVCQNGQSSTEETICSPNGQWEVINGSACPGIADTGSESTVNLLAIISGSLGSLLVVALLVCGILIMVITVISRKKGTVVSSSEEQNSGQSKHQDDEYEEVVALRNEAAHDKPEELEMMQNVAYGPLWLR